MAGAVQVLNTAGCALVGGHSGEGPELSLGFAINGLVDVDAQGQPVQVMRKTGAQSGDALILTKPLGTGTLFAAHALGRARGRWVEAALDSMAQSSQAAANVLAQFDARACTDVTGFGLLGHLVEMLQVQALGAQLQLSALPVLDGALECMQDGIFSSLHSSNAQRGSAIASPVIGTGASKSSTPNHPMRQALLFDPQTAGGLLASVPWEQAQACVQALKAHGYVHSAVIGRVCVTSDFKAPVALVEQ
jgi:selenide,water dikinase